MSRIASVFEQKGHKALIPYITVGYPDLSATLKVAELLEENGADIIELGIPFSDPMADGVTIQDSSYQALLKGINTDSCLEAARKIRQKSKVPLVFMTYFNPINAYGIEKFCRACAGVGVDGLIVPDLPPEEGAGLQSAAADQGLDMIYLLAPTSTQERIETVARLSRGYVYLVSVAGVTGARQSVPADLKSFVTRVRRSTSLPLCVGFGISTAEQAGEVAKIADGVIIGSKMIQLIKSDPTLKALEAFTRQIREALDQ